MKIEHQVCSLELAKKLKELGVKQESLYVWWFTEAMSTDVKYFPDVDWEKRENKLKLREAHMKDSGRDVAAFTVAELGEMLPDSFLKPLRGKVVGDRYFLYTHRPEKDSQWHVYYEAETAYMKWTKLAKEMIAPTEADARAKMLIYLLENKLITP